MSESCTLASFGESLCLNSIGNPVVEVVIEVGLLLIAFATLALAADHLCDSMETLCDHWGLPEEIGGATFMAFGGAVPEITVNSLATMKAIMSGNQEADAALGIGAILGSGLLAFLTVPALCSIASDKMVPLLLKRKPLTRDVLFYGVSVLVLIHALRTAITTIHGVVLILVYIAYVTTLCYGDQVQSWYTQWRLTHRNGVAAAMEPSKTADGSAEFQSFREFRRKENNQKTSVFRDKYDEELAMPLIETGSTQVSTESAQKCTSLLQNIQRDLDAVLWPLKHIIDISCPDCRIYQPQENLYALTFFAAFTWVSAASFLIGCVVDRWVVLLHNPSSSGFFGLLLVALGAEIPDAINALT
ncbi:Sodium/potassium/calcium exchanger 5 precursor, putative, partial [Perkinsus marinus ATCC 50983]